MSANEFLEDIYGYVAFGEHQKALDMIFSEVDRLLSNGEFGQCDVILAEADVSRLSTREMRSLLSVTYPAKHRLPHREWFYRMVEVVMVSIKGPKATDRLIGRLR